MFFGGVPTNMMSRREFLKLLGAGGTIMVLGGLGGFRSLLDDKKASPQFASAQTTPGGSWSLGQNTTVLAIHAALTPSGRIFYLAGSGFCINGAAGPYQARLLDPVTGAETTIGGQNNDLFCNGATQLANGNIFMCGGTKLYDTDVSNCNGKWHGGNFAYEFNVGSNSLSQQGIQQMAQGRWYPTCVTLPSGRILIVGGQDDYGDHNYITEIYDPATKSISINYDPTSNNTYCVGSAETAACAGAGSPCYGGPNQGVAPWLSLYPRMHLMPSGLVFDAGPTQATYLWDPSNGSWRSVNNTLQYRDYGTSFLLPLQNTTTERGKVMIVGGSTNDTTAATNIVEIEDFNQGTSTNPVLRRPPAIHHARKYVNPIILPNGKLVIFAGSSQNVTNPVLIPEMFDPENENAGWTDLPAATVPRVYHGIALLLPDGSVWTACSTIYSCTTEYRTEIFKPDYFSGTRPTISGTTTVGDYGQSITIPTPDAAGITRVSLVRLAASTHHYDANVRLVWLQITGRTSSSITVSAPINANLAPPGYYMIHVLNGSTTLVPSVARIIQIPGTGGGGTTTPPAQVAGLTATATSSTQINLAWTANPTADNVTQYNIYRSTTAGFTVNTATDTPIATPTTNSYSNTGLTASTTYYYRVAAVNTGGTGTTSDIASAATPAGTGTDTTPPTVSSTTPANGATGVATNIRVTIVFSEQMQASTVTWQNIAFRDSANNSIDREVGLATDNITCTVIPVAALTDGMTYTITVLTGVRDLAGNSMAAQYVFSFTVGSSGTTPPAQVAGLTATATSSTQINLAWTANPTADNVTQYNIYRSTTAGFTVNTATDTPIATPTTNSYSNTGLTASTTYYYRVAAVNTGGTGTPSNIASATTSGTTVIDTTPPTVTITSPANGASVKRGNVRVSGTASDNVGGSGIRNVQVRVNSGAFATATLGSGGGWSINANMKVGNGQTITARATDNAGNISTPVTITINVT